MPAERSIKPGWVDQLDKLESRELDKSASWEKLQNRLNKNPDNKNRKWVWISLAAAAMIGLIFLFAPLIKKAESETHIMTGTVVRSAEPGLRNLIPKTTGAVNRNTESVVISHDPGSDKGHDNKSKANQVKAKVENGEKIANSNEFIANNPEQIKQQPLAVVNVASTDQPQVIKKKMRVVHNNELISVEPAISQSEKPLIAKKDPIIFRNLLNPANAATSAQNESSIKQTTIRKPILPFSSVSQKD